MAPITASRAVHSPEQVSDEVPVRVRSATAATGTVPNGLAAEGCQLMLGRTGYEGSREDPALEAILGRRPDGVVLTGTVHSARGLTAAAERRHPSGGDLGPDAVAHRHAGGFSHADVEWAVADFLHRGGRQRRVHGLGMSPRIVDIGSSVVERGGTIRG